MKNLQLRTIILLLWAPLARSTPTIQGHNRNFLTGAVLLFCTSIQAQPLVMEEVQVWGERDTQSRTQQVNPSSVLSPEDLASINITTTEDLVKFEPSLVVRRRFIGDANGTLGIRGSNMFQTARSMVFADGVPLHYLLESRWNGAPRWTLVSASEIAQVEVLYGPFSAEYSGNSMGGVVNIETAVPQEREFHLDGRVFAQDFDAYGFDQTVSGHTGFASYGDKIGDLSLYLSYNRLQNESQPQSFYFGGESDSDSPRPVTGTVYGDDVFGERQPYFGDSGRVETTTDNVKLKLGHDWGDWSSLLNLAYEDRRSASDHPNSYLRTPSGETIWGGEVIQGGEAFSVPAPRLNLSDMNRRSLSSGLRLRGDLSEQLTLEANLTRFDILEDQTRQSARHPQHPDATPEGQVSDYEDTGWRTADLKLTAQPAGAESLTLTAGARHEAYRLNLNLYQSEDYRAGLQSTALSASGGETQIDALFTQLDWQLNRRWDLSLGGRYEDWRSQSGYYTRDTDSGAELERVSVPGNDRRRFSPKFSVGFAPDSRWQLRYSAAKAYRFPIVEELFSQYRAYNAVNEANPELRPEDGTHHNLMLERELAAGVLRLNLFQERIEDVIESQTALLPGGGSVRTFVPIDRVDTRGAELIANVSDVLIERLDLRVNLTYTRAEIVANRADRRTEGDHFPRMPRWRGNLLATYHLSDRWQLGGGLQYASNSFGRLDNADTARKVYGAQDPYTLLGLKTGYDVTRRFSLSAGIDNLTDERAYVAHPWPARTLYLNATYRQ